MVSCREDCEYVSDAVCSRCPSSCSFPLVRYWYTVDANGVRAHCWSCLEDCKMKHDCATGGSFGSTNVGACWYNRQFRS